MKPNNKTPHIQPISRWKVIAIILIIVTVLLAGSMTFFVTRCVNRAKKNDEASINAKQQKTKDTIDVVEKECSKEAVVTLETDSAEYLIVEEWGIKVRKPSAFSELSYSIDGDLLIFQGILAGQYVFDGTDVVASDFRLNEANNQLIALIRAPKNKDVMPSSLVHITLHVSSIGKYGYYLGLARNSTWKSKAQKAQATIAAYLLTYATKSMEAI